MAAGAGGGGRVGRRQPPADAGNWGNESSPPPLPLLHPLSLLSPSPPPLPPHPHRLLVRLPTALEHPAAPSVLLLAFKQLVFSSSWLGAMRVMRRHVHPPKPKIQSSECIHAQMLKWGIRAAQPPLEPAAVPRAAPGARPGPLAKTSSLATTLWRSLHKLLTSKGTAPLVGRKAEGGVECTNSARPPQALHCPFGCALCRAARGAPGC